jgi:hypothetical protein
MSKKKIETEFLPLHAKSHWVPIFSRPLFEVLLVKNLLWLWTWLETMMYERKVNLFEENYVNRETSRTTCFTNNKNKKKPKTTGTPYYYKQTHQKQRSWIQTKE